MTDERTLGQWATGQARHCIAKLAHGISATGLVLYRPGYKQTVRPAPGSVLASPATSFAAGDPDYFFHWIRDSAAVMEAARILANGENLAGEWSTRFNEFVRFSLSLRKIDGRIFLGSTDFRTRTAPEMQQWLRTGEEIAAVYGSRAGGEVRYNADGTLDFMRWSRPQHDGPATRALVAMRYEADNPGLSEEARRWLGELIDYDLGYTAEYAGERCFDIWEEELALHYYTILVQSAALQKGAERAAERGLSGIAESYRAEVPSLRAMLDRFWSPELGFYRSRLLPREAESSKALDFAVILGILHAGFDSGPHSVQDVRAELTLRKLEELFAAEYAINRSRSEGFMFGRYKGDTYVSGGAYYFCSFGAAEFFYRAARGNPSRQAALIKKGDAIFSRVRSFVPASGDLSEQFDQTTGAQSSAKDLSWSYASFITAWHARRFALGQGHYA